MSATQQSPKDAALAKCWELVKEKQKPSDPYGLPGKTWGAMSVRTRSVLVMLGGTSAGDPRELARKPWASLSDQDRFGIAACAREMGRELKDAVCLF